MLCIRNVIKTFDRIVAVDGLSFEIPEGCMFGFLGPNGVGKTTTMRMVLDILRPGLGHHHLARLSHIRAGSQTLRLLA